MNLFKKKYILAVLITISFFRVLNGCIELEVPFHLSKIQDRCSRGVREEGSSRLTKFRDGLASNVKEIIPSPHAELILGMVLGYNDLNSISRFNDVLTRAGTIHVVVVSGYNINLVFNYLSKLFGSSFQLRNLFILQIFAIFYALITGFEPPIVRALIMSSVFVWGSYYGRRIEVMYVFIIALLSMIVYEPKYIFDISFQLSSGATLGLIMFNEHINSMLKWLRLPGTIKDDLTATLSAQVFVWPLISYYFERISIVSFVVNPVILWLVPLITLIGIFLVICSVISLNVTRVIWLLVMPLSSLFVTTNEIMSRLPFAQVSLSVTVFFILIYLIMLLLLYKLLVYRVTQRQEKSVIV